METAAVKVRMLVTVACLVSCILLVLLYYGLFLPYTKVQRIQRVYNTAGKGITTMEDIITLLGNPSLSNLTSTQYWGTNALSETDLKRIAATIRYGVRTFYLPIVFEFSFDESGVLVGKHRYD